jgi:bacterioferritin
MNDSKLFPGTHPATEGSKYAKAVELPDPDLEPIEPDEDDKPPADSETAKAISMLQEMIKAEQPEKAPLSQRSPTLRAASALGRGIKRKVKEQVGEVRVRGEKVQTPRRGQFEDVHRWRDIRSAGHAGGKDLDTPEHHIVDSERNTGGKPNSFSKKLRSLGHTPTSQHYQDLADHHRERQQDYKNTLNKLKETGETTKLHYQHRYGDHYHINAKEATDRIGEHQQAEAYHSQQASQLSGAQRGIYRSLSKADPDTTGKLEGKFKVSCEKMISQLNKIISAEYSQWMRWYHYSLVLRGHCRDALAGHFEEHAEEELKHAEAVAMRVIGLGGYPSTDMEHPEPLREAEEILKELLRREQEGMQLYREVHAFCGDNEGTRQVLEGNMGQEQEHIDDLWRYLKNPDLIKANFSSGEDTMKPEKQKIKEYEHSFARRPDGISGTVSPDLPERGYDWHNEHGGPKPPPASKEDEEEQEEAENYFKEIPNPMKVKVEKPKSPTQPQTQEAMKALAGAPRFADGPVLPPRAVSFLLEHGFTPEEINAGEANMTPRMRGLYNRNLLSNVRKSISSLTGKKG